MDFSREGRVVFKTVKQKLQTIHSAQGLTPSSYIGLSKVIQNNDTKAPQSSETHCLQRQDRVEGSSTRSLPRRLLQESESKSLILPSTPSQESFGWSLGVLPLCFSHLEDHATGETSQIQPPGNVGDEFIFDQVTECRVISIQKDLSFNKICEMLYHKI